MQTPTKPPVENPTARAALERLQLTTNAIAAHRAQRFSGVISALSAIYADLSYDPGIVPDTASWLYLQEQTLKLALLVRDISPPPPPPPPSPSSEPNTTPTPMSNTPTTQRLVTDAATSEIIFEIAGIDQIPFSALQRLGAIFAEGELKYGRYNWRKITDNGDERLAYFRERYRHAVRHLTLWFEEREGLRQPSGEDHLAKVGWFVVTTIERERLAENQTTENQTKG
jgi:hypothetical protein